MQQEPLYITELSVSSSLTNLEEVFLGEKGMARGEREDLMISAGRSGGREMGEGQGDSKAESSGRGEGLATWLILMTSTGLLLE